MADIEKLIEETKLKLAVILDDVMQTSVARKIWFESGALPKGEAESVYERAHITEQMKPKIAAALDDLKVDLVRSIVEEEALAKNKYIVGFLRINSEVFKVSEPDASYGLQREIVELQEGDIPIGYRSYTSMFSAGSSSGTDAGGQEIVREVIVLRPVPEGNV